MSNCGPKTDSVSCRRSNVIHKQVNFVVLAVACWQAYEARDIKSEFAEAKYIAMAVFSLTQGFLTGLPIVVVARENPETFYLILTVLVFGVSLVVLSLIFIPKVLMQQRYGKLSVKEQRKKMLVSVRLSAGMEGEWSGSHHHFSSNMASKTSRPMMEKIQEQEKALQEHEMAVVRVSDLNNQASSDPSNKNDDTSTPGSGAFVQKDFSGRRVMSSYLEREDNTDDVQEA